MKFVCRRHSCGPGQRATIAWCLAAFLKTGRNNHTASFDAMNDVVSHSMQHMTDADLGSIAVYLKSLAPKNLQAVPFKADSKVATALFNGVVSTTGAQIYLDRCACCH
ncbi:hypothetical protein QN360_00830 [Glaciimonas sp. CA11.2]|uniref:hypothetical protein n=2 Tax=Glaciimonas TaxID=1229970 RepID=UPI002AB381CC|nr:hypothetical protein [Glaciimonas sp. CA11.2]MDY7545891.1 hypothetical protein [Glaciimonas sp. CA11.2]MEB0161451.1 hypothetical protein [Glaciimonas sp. CA11.2]